LSLSDKLVKLVDPLQRLEAMALEAPYELATSLKLTPLNAEEAKAWVYHGSRLLYLIQKRMEMRTIEEKFAAILAMADGYCSKEMRNKVHEALLALEPPLGAR
jgi:hypothetical protein